MTSRRGGGSSTTVETTVESTPDRRRSSTLATWATAAAPLAVVAIGMAALTQFPVAPVQPGTAKQQVSVAEVGPPAAPDPARPVPVVTAAPTATTPAPQVSTSQEPRLLEVPSLAGRSPQDAQAALTGAGLTVGRTVVAGTSEGPVGTVARTDPPAGTRVRAGSVVHLALNPAVVPDLVGTEAAGATEQRARMGGSPR